MATFASACARVAFALSSAAWYGAGSMRKSRWPSFTSAPSVKSRLSTIPFTRARTSATRKAEVRPGSSFVSVTEVGVTVMTPTSTGLAAGGRAAGTSASAGMSSTGTTSRARSTPKWLPRNPTSGGPARNAV